MLPQTTTQNKNLAAALWYGRNGYAVFPVHNPIHDDHGSVVGCTCEIYRRSDDCKAHHPHLYLGPAGACENPGKCPRVRWRDKSTTDEKQIRAWWGRAWRDGYIPNIGLDCGKSGILAVDLDTYKDHYTGADLALDEETVIVLTGGGGQHLWYRMGPGDTYGNATGDLPAGIDIRGHGGYVVVPPSLHKSGREYVFELDYGPRDKAPGAIPAALRFMLEDAKRLSPGPDTTLLPESGDCPDLSVFELSPQTLESIFNPAPKGQRSEADMSVCCALVAAGADDAQILGVFEQMPIGREGKFASAGRQYLAHTIGKARAYVAETAGGDQNVVEVAGAMIAWAKSTSFEEHVPVDLQSATGYRTDGVDTKLVVAVLGMCQARGSWRVKTGLRDLAELAGLGSPQTVQNALKRLDGWFCTYDPDKHMITVVTRLDSSQRGGDELLSNLVTTYQKRMGDDPYLSGISRVMKAHGVALAGALAIDPELYTVRRGGIEEEKIRPSWRVALGEYAIPGLGEGGLRVIDALGGGGEMTRIELAAATGKKPSAIATATRRLTDLGLVDVERDSAWSAGRYSLARDWEAQIEGLRTKFFTYGLGVQRQRDNAERLRDYLQGELDRSRAGRMNLSDEEIAGLQRRLGKAQGRVQKVVADMPGSDLTKETVLQWASIPNGTPAWAGPSAAVELEHKTMDAGKMLEWMGATLTPGARLNRQELATARTYAGRLGIDLSERIDQAGGYSWVVGA